MKQIGVKIRQRYNEKIAWQQLNPILEPGEIGIESDTSRFKCGDGRHRWTELEYTYGSGLTGKIFDGYDNEKTGANKEQVGILTDPDKVFKISTYKAEDHPGEIVIVPRQYTFKEEKSSEGNVIFEEKVEIIDTPYISLRKRGEWKWVIFSDQRNKPLVSSELGFFELNISNLG